MKDNEIIKALESLLDRMRAYESLQASIGKGLVEDIISMYNRQKAEIINRTEEYNDMLEQRNKVEEAYELCKQEYDSMLTANRNLMAEVERKTKHIAETVDEYAKFKVAAKKRETAVVRNIEQVADEEINRLKAKIKRLRTRNDELNALNKTASIEAIKEFAELVNHIIDEIVDIMFDDNHSKCMIANCQKHSSVPCESEICIDENKAFWKLKIYNLVAEMTEQKG